MDEDIVYMLSTSQSVGSNDSPRVMPAYQCSTGLLLK